MVKLLPWPWATWYWTWLTWLPTWPNLALSALSLINLDLAWRYNWTGQHTTPPYQKTFQRWHSYSLTAQIFKGRNWIDTVIKPINYPPWAWPWSRQSCFSIKSVLQRKPTWSLTWLTWSPTWPILALADLVTNLTKPSPDLDKSGPCLTL